jgi:L-type amino acid transporter 6
VIRLLRKKPKSPSIQPLSDTTEAQDEQSDDFDLVEPSHEQQHFLQPGDLPSNDAGPGSQRSGDDEQRGPPSRQLTFLNGLAIVIGLQIGSGIFSTPSQVSQFVSSPGTGVLVWILGGILVWTGAASFIELGLVVTRNGGVQEYLKFCYGDYMGYMFTWTWVTISKPASMAIIARVFAEHLCSAFLPQTLVSTPLIKIVAIVGLWTITAINCTGAKTGVTAANAFLVLKLTVVFAVAAIGITASLMGLGDGVKGGWFDSIDAQPLPLGTQIANFVTALFGALYCYGGWETVSCQ